MRKICMTAAAALVGLLAQSPAWSATYHLYQNTIHGIVFHNCNFNGGSVIHGIIIHNCHPIHGIIIMHPPGPADVPPPTK
jgi:hypothetical protein